MNELSLASFSTNNSEIGFETLTNFFVKNSLPRAKKEQSAASFPAHFCLERTRKSFV